MISDHEASDLAENIVKEYMIEPYTGCDEDLQAFFTLDALIYTKPEDALKVFRYIFEIDLEPRSIEGVGVGPLRTMIMLYGDAYDFILDEIRLHSKTFTQALNMAYDGL